MNNQFQSSNYVLSCNGTPPGTGLPYLPTLQQVRDVNRNILLNSGSYENAHFYLRSADGNNVTTAFYTNIDGGGIQSGDTDSYTALNLQPLGGLLTYGGNEVATKSWVFGMNNGDPNSAGFVRAGQTNNSLSTFNDLGTKSSFMGSIYANGNTPDGTTNTFWNVISAKHRNGMGDGVNHGLQIANIMSHGGSPNSGRMWFRNQFNGSWGNWYELATQNWVTAQIASSIPSLQAVSTVGNTTTNSIQLTGGLNGSSLVLDASTSSYKILSVLSGGWARGLSVYDSTGATLLGSVGFYGSAGGALTYGYLGPAYNNAAFKWNNTSVGIGFSGTGMTSNLFEVTKGTTTNTSPIAVFSQNGGNLQLVNGTSVAGIFLPVIKGVAAGTSPAWGMYLSGQGADSYTYGAITLVGQNASATGAITSGNVLSLRNNNTEIASVDYAGTLKLINPIVISKTATNQQVKTILRAGELTLDNVTSIGAIIVKHANTQNAFLHFEITIYGYGAATIHKVEGVFYPTAGSIGASGKTGLIITSNPSNFNTNALRAGYDAAGNICLIIGDVTSAWSTYLKVVIDSVKTYHSQYNNSTWEGGWNITVENDLSAYTSVTSLNAKIVPTQDYLNPNFILNQNTTDQTGNFRIAGNGRIGDYLAIGGAGTTGVKFYNRGNISTGTTSYGTYNLHEIQTDVTTNVYGSRMVLNFAADASPANIYYYRIGQGTLSGTNTVSIQHGIYIDDLSVANTNIGINLNLSAGTGKYNIYANGTANNYLAGFLGIGVANPTTFNASATLFPSFTPKAEIVTGSASGVDYTEGIVLRHTAAGSGANNRNLGIVFKLSNETSAGESSKSGAITLGSTATFANSPDMNFYIGNDATPKMKILNNGSIRLSSLAGTGTRILTADSSGNVSAVSSITVPQGGTGATSLTGVAIGNGTSAMTAVTGTANQLLRRNAANTGYEFFSPNYVSDNLYTANGTLTGNRIVNCNFHSLLFSNNGGFEVSGIDAITLSTIGDSIIIQSDVGLFLGTVSSYSGYITFSNLTAYRNWSLPNRNGTLAVLDDLHELTLQDVATVGNSFNGDLLLGISGSELYVGSTAIGDGNTRLGRSTLTSMTSGNWNTAIGSEALRNLTSGVNNTAIGEISLVDLINGNNNIAVGDSAGLGVTGGDNNIYMGLAAGLITNGNRARGNINIFIGRGAGRYDTSGTTTLGNYNIALGLNAGQSKTDANNQLFIGNYDAVLFPQHLIEGVMGTSQTLSLNAAVTISTLAGSGSRMVVADAFGSLYAQSIPGYDYNTYGYLNSGTIGIDTGGGYASRDVEVTYDGFDIPDDVEFLYRSDDSGVNFSINMPDPAQYPNRVLTIRNAGTDVDSNLILSGYPPVSYGSSTVVDKLYNQGLHKSGTNWVRIKSVHSSLGAGWIWLVMEMGAVFEPA